LIGESFEEAEEILPRIEAGLQEEEEIAALGRIHAALEIYEAGFSDLAAVTQEMISRQAQLTQLEPLFVNNIHELVNATRDELEAENNDTEQLLNQTRWLMIAAAFAASVVGFVATNQFARRARLSVKQAISEAQLASERALNIRLADENLRMNAELDVTRRLQSLLLPDSEELQAIPGLDVAGFMEPATEVGGDYYDVLSRNGRLKIGIGDVTGHGLESGVMMLMTQSAVRALLNAGLKEPVHFMEVVNETIFENARRMDSDRTMTLSLLDYIPSENGHERSSLIVSGYHEEVIVVRRDGKIERVDTAELGVPVGLVAEMADLIQQTRIELAPGDGIALYTDGITEAENGAGAFYGLDRLCRMISKNWDQSSSAIIETIVQDVRTFMGQQDQFDDVTLVILKQK
jgi:serine phosphatase RsbU (regulator of sigma subunit)